MTLRSSASSLWRDPLWRVPYPEMISPLIVPPIGTLRSSLKSIASNRSTSPDTWHLFSVIFKLTFLLSSFSWQHPRHQPSPPGDVGVGSCRICDHHQLTSPSFSSSSLTVPSSSHFPPVELHHLPCDKLGASLGTFELLAPYQQMLLSRCRLVFSHRMADHLCVPTSQCSTFHQPLTPLHGIYIPVSRDL